MLFRSAIITGITLDEALKELKIEPDVLVTDGDALWTRRSISGADWYYVCAPKGTGFAGTLDFRNKGNVEIWDPLTGTITPANVCINGDRTSVTLDLPQAGSCFVVFRKKGRASSSEGLPHVNGMLKQVQHDDVQDIPLTAPWTLAFPDGWGAPSSLQVAELKPWKDLDVSDEAKAFSGTATYNTTFNIDELKPEISYSLDLGRVGMIAVVSLNGKKLRTLWTSPYCVDMTEAVRAGSNTLSVEVTSTWFNRLVYDAGQPEEMRKTWTIDGPSKDMELRESGLLGPVVIRKNSL